MVTSQAIQNGLVSTLLVSTNTIMVHTVISIVSLLAYVVCVYMHTDTQLYYISVVMSNIGTNMYGGNIGSLVLCVHTCTQTHSCTIYQ